MPYVEALTAFIAVLMLLGMLLWQERMKKVEEWGNRV